MTVFIFDPGGSRVWEKLVGAHTRLLQRGVDLANSNQVKTGDVIFCHGAEEVEEVLAALKSLADGGALVISIAGNDRDRTLPVGNYYSRAKRVEPHSIDEHFRACVRHFLFRLGQTSTPTWELLEGPPSPDALLAYHLLGLLPPDPKVQRERDDLRPQAICEANVIAEATGKQKLEEDALDQRNTLRAFLAKCT